jgi:GxxExxY protein
MGTFGIKMGAIRYKAPCLKCTGEWAALASTTGEHKAQVLNYLKATGMRLGLLINFGRYPKATVERIVL